MSKDDGVLGTLRWLTGITRPVHAPLAISTLCRVVNLSLDIVLFGLAAGGVVGVLTGHMGAGELLALLALVSIAKAGAYYLEQFTGHYVAFKALELLRTQMFSDLLPQAPGVVAEARSGDLLSSLTRDVDRIEVVYAYTFAPLVSALVVPLGALVLVGAGWGWELIPIPLGAVLVSLFVVPWMGMSASFSSTRQTLERRRALTQHLTDSAFGVDEVTTYGQQDTRIRDTDSFGRQVEASSRTPTLWVAVRRGTNRLFTVEAVVGV